MGPPKKHRSRQSILYIINALDTGGAEVGMCRLLDGLDANRYDVTVVSLNGCNPSFLTRVPDDVTVINIKDSSVHDVSTIVSEARTVDVIVGSLYHSVLLARILGLLNRDATIATWQHNEVFKTEIRKYAIGLTNKLSDVVLADSEPVAEMYCDEFDVDSKFVKTVPIAGIDLDKYEPKHHQDKDTVLVGSVGRLVEQKNYRALVKVAEGLIAEDIEFRIVGDGPLRSNLKNLIKRKELDNIELVGEIEDVPSFLESLDIYIQPSRWEGLCMTVIEAMAAGLPIVASAVGGIEYNVTNDKNGFLHEPGDVNGYSDSIRRLAGDPAKRQQFGQRGREIVKRSYTQEVLVSEFEKSIL